MLIHGKPGILFKCNEMTCILNQTFNLVVFTDYTAVQGTKAHSVGFAVPVKYINFITQISPKFSSETDLSEIFKFERPEDKKALQDFVRKQNNTLTSIFKRKR